MRKIDKRQFTPFAPFVDNCRKGRATVKPDVRIMPRNMPRELRK